jgi:hypothetical protein
VEKEQLRLEILKLCNRHDHTADLVIAKAKLLEAYVTGKIEAVPVEAEKSASKKSKGNSNIFS